MEAEIYHRNEGDRATDREDDIYREDVTDQAVDNGGQGHPANTG